MDYCQLGYNNDMYEGFNRRVEVIYCGIFIRMTNIKLQILCPYYVRDLSCENENKCA